ncbi:ABC transporter substrate-binding protein [Desulfopila sp. IMCC35008]|uniref:ABC transporter substrate-binding protein n=1 Tax=Desulfopila sp. IMCC35008 TaxID=2653858 RepID=UPI0013D88B8C|nr:extracellular solute-binding protein [Desulfopila sp. IMCC35008]
MGKKIFYVLAVLGIFILLGFMAVYFSTGNKDITLDAEHSDTREATLYHYFSGSLSGGINEMLEKINQQQGTTQVVAHALDHEAFKSMITESMTQEMAPDLFTYWAGAKTQTMVDQQLLEPIDDLWEDLSLDDRFPTPIIEAASTYNNQKYLLPITQHIVVFFYNKQIFKNADIDPPVNWEQFIEACDTLKQEGITPIALGARERWPAQFWFDYLLLRTAGPKYRAALMRGERSYLDPEVVSVYATWSSMIQAGYFNTDANEKDWAQATEKVCKGEAAATLMGTWAIQLFTGNNCRMEAERDFDYFVFPTISPNVPGVSVGPIDGIVMTRETRHRVIAAKVMAYASEEAPQKLMSTGSGALAPSREVPGSFYSTFKQRLLQEIQTTEYWAFNYDLATPPEVAERGLDSFNELIAFPGEYQEILKYLQETLHELFVYRKTEESID